MMQTSVPGHYKLKSHFAHVKGFTLLELMVVLIVTGISFGLLLPNFMKNEDDFVKEESVRLIALMEYAADYAASTGRWLALSTSTTGYQFVQRGEENGDWQPLVTDDVLRARQLPEGMFILAMNHQQGGNVLIMLSPSGIHAPFKIQLVFGESKRLLQGNLLGRVEVVSANLVLSAV